MTSADEAAIEGYRLFYDQEGSDEFVELELAAERTAYICRGLRPNTMYRCG